MPDMQYVIREGRWLITGDWLVNGDWLGFAPTAEHREAVKRMYGDFGQELKALSMRVAADTTFYSRVQQQVNSLTWGTPLYSDDINIFKPYMFVDATSRKFATVQMYAFLAAFRCPKILEQERGLRCDFTGDRIGSGYLPGRWAKAISEAIVSTANKLEIRGRRYTLPEDWRP